MEDVVDIRCTLTLRLFRGPPSRSSCSLIVTGYFAVFDGSIGSDAIVAAMLSCEKNDGFQC